MRAFTLVEVLVAAMLLALIAAATLPFFQGASDVLGRRDTSVEKVTLLGTAATLLMASPEWERSNRAGTVTFTWPPELAEASQSSGLSDPIVVQFPTPAASDAEGESVDSHSREAPRGSGPVHSAEFGEEPPSNNGTSVAADDDDSAPQTRSLAVNGVWIEFRCGEIAIHRWLAQPKNERTRRRQPRPRNRHRSLSHRGGHRTSGGMTLVEVVVALALLGALAVAAAGWTTTGAQLAHSSTSQSNERSAAHAALRLIADDLRSWDMDPNGASKGRRANRSSREVPSRVTIEGDALVIRTRDPDGKAASSQHRYSVSRSTDTLERSLTQGTPRPLLDGVKSLNATLDEKSGVLTVALELSDGHRIERIFVVP